MHLNICKKCNSKFEHSRIRSFCSKICRYSYQGNPKTIKKCLQCNQDFSFYKSVKPKKDAKHCNIACRRSWNNNPVNKIPKLKELLDKYTIKNPTGCWSWTGSFFPAGYGQTWFQGKQIHASRASWIVNKGLIKSDQWVLHTCDNRECTNPNHLFLGTCKDNVHDMIKKGRKIVRRGTEVHNSKLNEEKVSEIRKLLSEKFTLKYLSEKFGVNISNISAIKNNKTWKHVT